MALEAQITVSLAITRGNLQYQSKPTAFRADVNGGVGPTPGTLTVSKFGTNIDLTQITGVGGTAGLAWFQNLDTTGRVEYGIYDTLSLVFYPLGMLLPGECYVLRLSPDLGKDEPGTGSGTALAGTTRLRFRSIGAACLVRVDVFQY